MAPAATLYFFSIAGGEAFSSSESGNWQRLAVSGRQFLKAGQCRIQVAVGHDTRHLPPAVLQVDGVRPLDQANVLQPRSQTVVVLELVAAQARDRDEDVGSRTVGVGGRLDQELFGSDGSVALSDL